MCRGSQRMFWQLSFKDGQGRQTEETVDQGPWTPWGSANTEHRMQKAVKPRGRRSPETAPAPAATAPASPAGHLQYRIQPGPRIRAARESRPRWPTPRSVQPESYRAQWEVQETARRMPASSVMPSQTPGQGQVILAPSPLPCPAREGSKEGRRSRQGPIPTPAMPSPCQPRVPGSLREGLPPGTGRREPEAQSTRPVHGSSGTSAARLSVVPRHTSPRCSPRGHTGPPDPAAHCAGCP